jgi:hypothetical protein
MSIQVPIRKSFLVVSTLKEAFDALEEAERRGIATPMPAKSGAASVPEGDPWQLFVEYLREPSQVHQLRLLHALKEHGKEVSREDLCVLLDIDGSNGFLRLGGVFSGIAKKATKLGLKLTNVIARTDDGYRAGSLVLENTLPEVDPA